MKKANFKAMSRFDSAEESPGFLLWQASTLWRRKIEQALKPLSLTHPQFVVLAAVGWLTQAGDPTTQVAISRFTEIDPNTTSQILRSLIKKEFVERVPGADERSKSPFLTKSGAILLQKALPTVEQVDKTFFEGVDLRNEPTIQALKKLGC